MPYCVRPNKIHLPNEILAIIIKEVASKSEVGDYDSTTRAALASCRLASHVLYSVATPLLFSSIEVKEPFWENPDLTFEERATMLKQILTTASDIPASVHTLKICCPAEYFENSINGTLISEIIYRLPHIRTFFLHSVWNFRPFAAITEDLKLAIKALCASPNLTTLDLHQIRDFPFTIIITCPNLQCLRLLLVRFWFGDMNVIDEKSSLQLHKLKSLKIDDCSIRGLDLGDSDSNSFNVNISLAKLLSRIKNLQIVNFFRESISLRCGWRIMLMASQSLTTLDLSMDVDILSEVFEIIPFDLGRFPALRHFKIQIPIRFKDNVTMLGRLNQLLSGISSSTSGIETLEIMITWIGIETGGENELFSSDAGWSRLDEVLSSDKFAFLKKVFLGLSLEIRRIPIPGEDYYRRKEMDQELARALIPLFVNTLFSRFKAFTSTQSTLEIHIEII